MSKSMLLAGALLALLVLALAGLEFAASRMAPATTEAESGFEETITLRPRA
jgi:hypothetical protein